MFNDVYGHCSFETLFCTYPPTIACHQNSFSFLFHLLPRNSRTPLRRHHHRHHNFHSFFLLEHSKAKGTKINGQGGGEGAGWVHHCNERQEPSQ